MKKVLFATTALVATAGVASADIALSGSAEMGVQGGSGTGVTRPSSTRISTSPSPCPARPTTALTFGAAIDIDENAGRAFGGPNDGGVAIFISGDFGTLTLGDTDGALDWAMQEVNFNGGGSLGDDETGHAGFSGNASWTVTTTVRSCATTTPSATSRSRLGRAGRRHDRPGGIAFNIPNGFGSQQRCDR
jgi:outer membrane protein OmpU